MGQAAFQAAGTPVTSTGATSASWPSHQANDVGVLVIASRNQTISTPSGWTQFSNSPQGTGTAGVELSSAVAMFWRRAAGAAESAASIADSGVYQTAGIITVRGCPPTGDPFDVTAGSVTTPASTTITIPGGTTTVDNCLIVWAESWDLAAPGEPGTNSGVSNPSGVTNTARRLVSEGQVTSVGGGIAVWTGEVRTAGVFGALSSGQDTASLHGNVTAALISSGGPNTRSIQRNIGLGVFRA